MKRTLKKGDHVALNVAEVRRFGLPDWYGMGTVLVDQRKDMVLVRFDGGLEIKLHREYLIVTREAIGVFLLDSQS